MNSQKNEERKFIITENLATAILQYLAKKPYEEVYPLIGGLQQLAIYSVPENSENTIKENKVE